MAFDLSSLLDRVDEFADLKIDDLERFKGEVSNLKRLARESDSLDGFKDWVKSVNRRASVAVHRRSIQASGVNIDTASDPDLARVAIDQLTEGNVRPAIYGGEVMRYDGQGLYREWSRADLSCSLMSLDGAPYFDQKGKPQHLNMSTKRTKDVITAIASKLSGCIESGGLGRGDSWFDESPPGIMFLNCFLTVRGGRVVSEKVSPNHRATKRHEFVFDPARKAPRFLAYIQDMLTPEQIPAIQELLGAALFGVGPKYQRAGFIRGKPGTGKSTLVKVLKGIIPSGAVTSSEPGDWSRPQFAALLHGITLNGVEELRNTHFGDVNTIKSVIVGDQMSVKEVYKPVFAFRPTATHIIASNEWPRTSNSDRAFWDRWLIFDLKGKRFRGSKDQVRDFDQVLLREELPGIVSWVVDGMSRLASQGAYTEINDGAGESWKSESSNIAVFARECLRLIGEAGAIIETPKRKVYESYRGWCHECGYQPLGRNKFYSAILREDHIQSVGRTGTSFNVRLIDRPWRSSGAV